MPKATQSAGGLIWALPPKRQAAQQFGVEIAVVQTNRSAGRHFIKSVLAVTDPEGRFQFGTLPANEQYAIFSPVGGVVSSSANDLILYTKTFQCRDDDD